MCKCALLLRQIYHFRRSKRRCIYNWLPLSNLLTQRLFRKNKTPFLKYQQTPSGTLGLQGFESQPLTNTITLEIMKAGYECKVKTGAGRNVTILLGHHETIQYAITEATTGIKSRELIGAVKITIQLREDKVSSRKKIGAKG